MTKGTSKEITKVNYWTCMNCDGHPGFEHEQMMEHLRSVHNIDPKATKANRSMVTHIDGEDYFASTWEWKLGDLIFIQNTVDPRSEEDLMRY